MNLELDISVARDAFRLDASCRLSGNVWGLAGPSGAGKTTLLNCLAGLVKPSTGRIVLDGDVLLDTTRGVNVLPHKRSVGYVFQDDRLFPHLSVEGNLRYAGKLARRRSPSHVGREEIIDLLEIRPLLSRGVSELSGGEKRRVSLARAMLARPRLLLCDEPLAGLDHARRSRAGGLINRLASRTNVPIVIVSHRMSDLLSMTRKLILLRNGQLLGAGKYMDLIAERRCRDALGPDGVLNVLPMRVATCCTGRRLAMLRPQQPIGPGRPVVIRAALSDALCPGAELCLTLQPDDVILSSEPVENTSVQNQLRGVCKEVFTDAGRVLCRIDAGVELLAAVTHESAQSLQLRPGRVTWCLFKARSALLGQPGEATGQPTTPCPLQNVPALRTAPQAQTR